MTTASERLMEYLDDGRLLRKQWTGIDRDGRDTACLLAAMSKEVRAAETVASCPADIMPAWMAYLTVFIDDKGTIEQWPSVVRRYAGLAGRWHALDAAGWKRADYRCRRAVVVEAMKRTDNVKALDACHAAIAFCDKMIAGGISDAAAAVYAAGARKIAAAAYSNAHGKAYNVAFSAYDAAAFSTDTDSYASAVARPAACSAAYAATIDSPITADAIIAACLDCLEDEIVLAEARH